MTRVRILRWKYALAPPVFLSWMLGDALPQFRHNSALNSPKLLHSRVVSLPYAAHTGASNEALIGDCSDLARVCGGLDGARLDGALAHQRELERAANRS